MQFKHAKPPTGAPAQSQIERLAQALVLTGMRPDEAREEAARALAQRRDAELSESLERLTDGYCLGF